MKRLNIRKALSIIVFIVCGSFSVAGMTQQQNVVVLDAEAAIFNTDFAKQKIADLEKDALYKSRLDQFKALNAELAKMQEDAKVNSLTWSETQKQDYQRQGQAKAEERSLIGKQLESERQNALRSVQQELTPVLEKVVTALVEEQKIELILNSRAIIYSNEKNTITQMVIDKLNAELTPK